MAGPYSEDLREKKGVCYQHGQGGLTQKAVAERFLVSESCFTGRFTFKVATRYFLRATMTPSRVGLIKASNSGSSKIN
jgi:transposase